MLKRFYVNNFRSLLNFEFRPAGLNLLIGENNAGKTNLCCALNFIGSSSGMALDEAAKKTIGEVWNITNVFVKDDNISFEVEADIPDPETKVDLIFKYSLKISPGRGFFKQTLLVSEEKLSVTGGKFKNTLLIKNDSGKMRLLHEKRFLSGDPDHYLETQALQTATMLSRLYDPETNRRANLFKSYLQSWRYFNLNPHALRLPDVISDYPVLRHDGANLSKVLFMLHNEDPRVEKKIIEVVRDLEPKLELFTFNSPDPEHVYLFYEDSEANRFGTHALSDGTLRYLAITYLILSVAKEIKSSGFTPLSLIEEPENGLYVGCLKPLIQKIDPAGSGGQFLFTSHSPYFIDLFDQNPEGLHIVKRGRPSSMLVRPDAAKIRELLSEMPLGEMHFRQLLG